MDNPLRSVEAELSVARILFLSYFVFFVYFVVDRSETTKYTK
jgi:hypothetical protein